MSRSAEIIGLLNSVGAAKPTVRGGPIEWYLWGIQC